MNSSRSSLARSRSPPSIFLFGEGWEQISSCLGFPLKTKKNGHTFFSASACPWGTCVVFRVGSLLICLCYKCWYVSVLKSKVSCFNRFTRWVKWLMIPDQNDCWFQIRNISWTYLCSYKIKVLELNHKKKCSLPGVSKPWTHFMFLRWFKLMEDEVWLTSWGKGNLSHNLQGYVHPRWVFGISESSTVVP